MSRQEVINAKREAIARQEELLKVQKKHQSRHGGSRHTVEHTEYVIRGLKAQVKHLENYQEPSAEEKLRDTLARFDRLTDRDNARNVKLRAECQAQLDALTG